MYKDEQKNIYKNVNFGTNSIYINYLKHNNYKHAIENISPSKKRITILTMENEPIESFEYPLYPNSTKYALNLTEDKFRAEEHFHKVGINTTKSKIYSYREIDKAKFDYFHDKNKNEARVVIKPLKSSFGRGVFVNVSEDRFNECWKLSHDDLTISELRSESELQFLVQNYLKGFEVRATILQGTLVALIARIPPYVEGDGENNIKNLINLKNKERDSCAYLRRFPIKINSKILEFLKSHKLDLTYIPKNKERVLLSSVSNIANGGELINITQKVSENIKTFALDVLASIPGLYSGGLDLMLTSLNDPPPHVIEVNVFPVISLTKYPTYGESSNPAKILFESLISQYQVGDNGNSFYNIPDKEIYIKNFIEFSKRSVRFLDSPL